MSFTIFTSFTRKENRQYSYCCLASICIQFPQLVFGLVKHHTLSRGVGSTLCMADQTTAKVEINSGLIDVLCSSKQVPKSRKAE